METQGGPKLTWSSLFANWMSSSQSPRACVSNALKLSWKKKSFQRVFWSCQHRGRRRTISLTFAQTQRKRCPFKAFPTLHSHVQQWQRGIKILKDSDVSKWWRGCQPDNWNIHINTGLGWFFFFFKILLSNYVQLNTKMWHSQANRQSHVWGMLTGKYRLINNDKIQWNQHSCRPLLDRLHIAQVRVRLHPLSIKYILFCFQPSKSI